MKVSYRDQFGNWKLSQNTIEEIEIEIEFDNVDLNYNEDSKVLTIRKKGE